MRRILMIDDDPAVGAATKLMLEHEGFDVTVVEDGQSGLNQFKLRPYDAIIVDIFMPGLDGFATIKAFRQISATVPVIAISGFMDLYAFRDSADQGPDILSMAAEFGAVQSVEKPFRPRDLLRAVNQSLGVAA
jgi:DNA-binding response OmpR family regulator